MASNDTHLRGASGPATLRVPAPRRSWDPPALPPPQVRRRRGPLHRLLRALLGLVLLAGAIVVVADVVLMTRLDRVDGAFSGLRDRPSPAPGTTLLVVGTGAAGSGPDVPWLAGEQSVEAVLLVELAPDGSSASVRTLPRGSGIDDVVASTPPSAAVSVVETWSGVRVDHLVAIDWTTLVGLPPEMPRQPLDLVRTLLRTADATAVDDDLSPLDLDLLLLDLSRLRASEVTGAGRAG